MNKKIISITLLLISFNFLSCNLIEEKPLSEIEEIITITDDDESSLRQAMFKLWKQGGIVYIDTPVINFKDQGSISVTGFLEGGIVGIKQSNGEYPRLNFKEQRDNATYYNSGIDVVGSNKIIKNLIIENAGRYGIFINGQKNTIDHVITRYNGDSGIFLSSECDSNTFNYCFSYRNFNFLDSTVKAEGFSVEIGVINTVFNYCFAWDNGQNGFGYKYWNGKNKDGTLTYTHSASWNNGNIDVFSGKYDFDNGKALDKNLRTIQAIITSDAEFEDNYNDKKFNLKNALINSKSANEYFSSYSETDGGNGFDFGDEKCSNSPSNIRIADYCVAFDHKSKGFNNNKSKDFTGLFTNCVGFNNNMNYELPYSFSKWSNNWSWGSEEEDQFDLEVYVKEPSNTKTANRKFNSIKEQIIKAVNSNTILDDINFDKTIKSLYEK